MPSWSFSDMELLALFVSSLGHDLDHRGTNNQYQMSSVSKARPQTRHGLSCMFYMHMIRVSYTVSYKHVPVQEKFCMQGYFCLLRLVQDSAPFQMAIIMIKTCYFKFVYWHLWKWNGYKNFPVYSLYMCTKSLYLHVYQRVTGISG